NFSGSAAVLLDVDFSGNTAAVFGGAINGAGSTFTISESTFTGNEAREGGGIFHTSLDESTLHTSLDESTLHTSLDESTLSAVTFVRNVAEFNGGGMVTSSPIQLMDVRF